jgi:hypothetical protein
MRLPWLRVACVALVLAVPAAVSSCSIGQAQLCAGQCGPPFKLDVVFRHGTSVSQAGVALRRCARETAVVTVGVPYRSADGLLHATVGTREVGGSRTRPLLSCLDRSPPVLQAVWPD